MKCDKPPSETIDVARTVWSKANQAEHSANDYFEGEWLFIMNNNIWKKTAISSLALLMLAGGSTAAFADAKGNGHGKGQGYNDRYDDDDDDRDDDKKGKNNAKWKFKDEDDMEWAMEYIMRLAAKGIFTGYEDGTFKPHQTISRLETLVAAVRLMGLGDKAETAEAINKNLHFKDAKLIEQKYGWSKGYISVALENDLFFETDTEVKPADNATRLWSTILLVKALKLEDEAKKLNNTKLDFADADQIPAGSVGYVKLALDKGIITGYVDKKGKKTFRPNQPVTRAELAALLDRTDSQLPDLDASAITGKLKASASNGTITIVRPNNTELTISTDPNVFIFKDGKKVSLSALAAGDEVLVRTYENRVVFIEVVKSTPVVSSFQEIGVIHSLGFNSQAKLSTISLTRVENGNTLIFIKDVASDVKIVGDASKLKVGEIVIVKGVDKVVNTIEIQ